MNEKDSLVRSERPENPIVFFIKLIFYWSFVLISGVVGCLVQFWSWICGKWEIRREKIARYLTIKGLYIRQITDDPELLSIHAIGFGFAAIYLMMIGAVGYFIFSGSRQFLSSIGIW